MSIWYRLGELVTGASVSAKICMADVLEAMRAMVGGDPQLRRRITFSIAMIALSAKMAKADGVVTQNEIRAFQEIFSVPPQEVRNVARLYDIAKSDVAGFEAYAGQLADLCDGDGDEAMLEDILDGLFHIAKADGLLHERETRFLRRVAEVFAIEDLRYESLLARHLDRGEADPYVVLGVESGASFEAIRKHYRALAASNHPDRLIGRGMPEEFIAIATARLAAINAAYESIEREARRSGVRSEALRRPEGVGG